MTVPANEQSKRTLCIALYNQLLHRNNVCPGNHDVAYAHGWFYFDNEPCQRPEITRRADELIAAGMPEVLYSEVWNTFVLDGEYIR